MEGHIDRNRAPGPDAPCRLWLYWETPQDRQVPAYIALCHAAIVYRCRDIDLRLVRPWDVPELLPDLPDNISRVTTDAKTGVPTLAVKTGFIRTFLLARYGGLYLDIDCLPMRSLVPIFAAIERYGFVAIRRTSAPKRHVSIGLLGARRGSPVIAEYSETLYRKLSEGYLYKWGDIGAWTLTPIVERYPDDCLITPEDMGHPIVAENQHAFLSKTLDPEDLFSEHTLLAMLFHRPFTGPSPALPKAGIEAAPRGWLADLSIEDLYSGDILLSKLFRRALPEEAFAAALPAMKETCRGGREFQ